MGRGLKIFVSIMVLLGVFSLIFLFTAKKKTQTMNVNKTNQAGQKKATIKKVPAQKNNNQNQNQAPTKAEVAKITAISQWQKCNDKTIAKGTTLFWSVKITEAIPAGGTYAKGFLYDDAKYPVRVVIKSGIPIVDKIKERLTVGNMASLRGACTEIAPDGSVVFEVF